LQARWPSSPVKGYAAELGEIKGVIDKLNENLAALKTPSSVAIPLPSKKPTF